MPPAPPYSPLSRMRTADTLEADFIIVGAGSAGCALAARLSEDPHVSVALLEAGHRSLNPWLHVPIGYFKTVSDPRHDWRFQTEPEPMLEGRQVPQPRGKGLGGSSLLNGMLYVRGHRKDYDRWAALGNPGWDWDSVLPYFQRSSHREDGAGPTCGRGGPLWISNVPPDPVSEAFIASAEQAGVPRTENFNAGDNTGAGYFQMNTRGGYRMSSARAYLAPARRRSNLKVIDGASVLRVVMEGGRASGVEVLVGDARKTFKARREVVLSAGAIQSPQLLQLSGIGAARQLESLGIEVLADLPGVGENLQDHLQVRPSYRCRDIESLNDIANSPWRSAREFLRYVTTRSGALRNGVYRAGAFLSVGPDSQSWPDVQIHFGLVSFDRPHQPPHAFSGITLSACILRPESRGSVRAGSKDPLKPPLIRAGYLESESDLRLAVAMVHKMREIASKGPLARHIVDEHEPGRALRTDEEIVQWVRRRAGSIFHPVGTCAMGPDSEPMAVVDGQLRVRGVKGLRVVDASVMPRIVSGNTNAPAIMIAERAADLMKQSLSA
jgi:choline dehydrogenase